MAGGTYPFPDRIYPFSSDRAARPRLDERLNGSAKTPILHSWDIDFSISLRNRTGKYFVGRDVIAAAGPRVRAIRFGRFVRSAPPREGSRRILIECSATVERALCQSFPRIVAGLRPDRPVLHLDPYTAAHYRIAPSDLVLCHDMGPITHPDLFDQKVTRLYQEAYARIVARGCGMAFVSRASRNAFAAIYGTLPRMEVIYPPLRAELSRVTPEPIQGVQSPFLLTVGSIGRRKNQAACIRAFREAALAADGFNYVLCGSREPGAEEIAELARTTPGVLLLPYVSDGQLAWLYQKARGFVLVSHLEGFGVPVAEAIAYGLVPLISRDSVMEEVAGPSALTADPASDEEIARALRALADMGDDQRALCMRSLLNSLDRFTQETFRARWQALLDADG